MRSHQILPDGLLVHLLLDSKSNPSNHGKTTIVDFFGLNLESCLRVVFGEKAQGIEANLTGSELVTHLPGGRGTRGVPADGGSVSFTEANAEEDDLPELREDGLDFLEVTESRATLRGEDGVILLLDNPTHSGQHSNTSVGQFGLTETLGLRHGECRRVGKAERIPESGRCADAGCTQKILLALGNILRKRKDSASPHQQLQRGSRKWMVWSTEGPKEKRIPHTQYQYKKVHCCTKSTKKTS